ncbi:tail Collar domain-containing protein [Arenicella chitinivorans]|uniref:Tail Collar domain-containing protein n=1 Tax=Arenicella chitinivorans TaxID=1329800 RepID=A0A918RY72_9GAMM|nr:tail fiber protein [Arenicella chitinivorans]GHA13489.1 tail Collar domain-containing protein [Arenicella chitinivorans]
MSEPFLAEVRMVGFNFAPRGWAFCDGQILPINQNQSLYSLLGTTYGGDGRSSFALPDLRGRVPMHTDNGVTEGHKSGEETHTLSANEIPQHQHYAQASTNNGSAVDPTGRVLGQALNVYANPTATTTLRAGSVTNVGGGQAHNNMQPSIVINFCIALKGLFPSRN